MTNAVRPHRLASAALISAVLLTFTGCALWAPQPSRTSASALASLKASLNFGSVHMGAGQVVSDSVQNVTNNVVSVKQISSSDPDFKINAPSTYPFNTLPGRSFDLVVSFQPRTAGLHNTVISIVNSASITTIPVSATAVIDAQLTASAPSINFGSVQIGHTQTSSEIVTNSGSANVTLTQASVSGSGFGLQNPGLPMTLAPGQSKTFTITFVPPSAGTANGSLTLTSDASNSTLDIPLTGTGTSPGTLTDSPTSIDFGNVVAGTSKSLSEVLTNSGGSNVTVSQVAVTGAGFSLGALSLPLTLTPGQSVSFNVSLSSATTGVSSGDLAIASDASNASIDVPLTANVVSPGHLSANPASFDFGSVQVGANQTLSGALTNSGGSSVTLTQANVTGAGFSVTGLSLPATVAPAQSLAFTVRFSPATTGTVTGQVNFVSNASNSTLQVPLSGTGLSPGQLSASPSSVGFGNVLIGNSQSTSITLTNSGGSSLTISQAVVNGNAFGSTGLSVPVTLAAGQSTTFNTQFAPTSPGSFTGFVTITSNAPNATLSIPLSGAGVTPGQLTVNPASLVFGNIGIGSSHSLSETISNTGGSNLSISQVTLTGTGFSASALSLPMSLAPSQSTTITVSFAPTSAGGANGNIAVVSSVSTANIPLSGTGVTPGQLTASSTSLSFGNVVTGASATQSETLTNSGGADVTISQVTPSGTGYGVSGISLPLTLTSGQSTSFNVRFAPSSTGTINGNLAISSNASNATVSVGLSGTGVAPGTLSASPTSLNFGSVQIGNTSNLTETLSNSGGVSVTISGASITGSAYGISGLSTPLTLTPGQSTTFTVRFSPSSSGAANGSVALTSDASNSTLNVSLSGNGVTPGTLSANPSSLSFGNVQTGTSRTLSETLSNTGGTSVNVSSITPGGTGVTITGVTPPISLAAGQSVTFSVVWAPSTTGSLSGSIAVSSNASNASLSVALSGTATAPGQLAVNPTSINFGNVVVGSAGHQTATLSATGASVTVTSVGVSGSDFSVSGISLPLTIAAGSSTSFTVTFAPGATGSTSANVSFASNASNGTITQSVSGTGTAPPQHSVTLNWSASTSSNVSGYNVYRGTSTGGPYTQINSVLNSSTGYVDNTVQAGQTYFYVVTAVNSSSQESGYSNEVRAVVPTP